MKPSIEDEYWYCIRCNHQTFWEDYGGPGCKECECSCLSVQIDKLSLLLKLKQNVDMQKM